MADNVPIIDGLGQQQPIATDSVVDAALSATASQFQYTKLVDGTVGGTNKSSVNSAGQFQTGDVDARRLQELMYLQRFGAFLNECDSTPDNHGRGFEVR